MTVQGVLTGNCPVRPQGINRDGPAAGKLDAIEWVRVAAACGVVWFHIKDGPFKHLGHGGLICFVLISVVFQALGAEKDAFGAYMGKKAVRIMPPWLFWLAFYGLFNLAKGKELFPSSEGVATNILTGTWVGLWYFPFILIASPVVFSLALATVKWNPLAKAACFLLVGLVMLAFSPHVSASWKSQEPWGQWFHALPAIPIGLGMHGLLRTTRKTRLASILILVVLVEFVCLEVIYADCATAVPYAVAVPMTGLGFLITSGLPPCITRLGGFCLGVYLIHSAVLSVLKLIPVAGSSPWFLLAAAVISSFWATAVMRKNPWCAKVL